MKKLFTSIFIILFSILIYAQAAQCPHIYYSIERTITQDSVVNIQLTIDSQIWVGSGGNNPVLLFYVHISHDYIDNYIPILDSQSFNGGNIIGNILQFKLNNVGSFNILPIWEDMQPDGSYYADVVGAYCHQQDTFNYPIPYIYPQDTTPVDTITLHTSILSISNTSKIYFVNKTIYIEPNQIKEYQVYDLIGQMVLQDDKNIVQTNLNNGVYIIVVKLLDGTQASNKIFIN